MYEIWQVNLSQKWSSESNLQKICKHKDECCDGQKRSICTGLCSGFRNCSQLYQLVDNGQLWARQAMIKGPSTLPQAPSLWFQATGQPQSHKGTKAKAVPPASQRVGAQQAKLATSAPCLQGTWQKWLCKGGFWHLVWSLVLWTLQNCTWKSGLVLDFALFR